MKEQELAVAMGRRIRARRALLGLKQYELAQTLGVHYRTLCAWERGRSLIPSHRYQSVAKAIGVPVGYLFGEAIV